ncbi:MAG: sulfotransferase domain-containing protein [Pseudomonadota bacterium]
MIVWLASYPRSGNTFVRMILREYFGVDTYSMYNDELDIGESRSFSNIVGHRSYQGGWDEFYASAAESDALTPIKTHDAPPDDAKAIYIVRDPEAVMVSLYHYLQNFGRHEFTMEDVILGATSFGGWSAHLKAWNPKSRISTLFMKYEDIVAAPEKAAGDIAAFLNLEKKDAALPAFSELQKANPKFFRSGSDARNKSELSESQRALMHFLYGTEMRALGYDAPEAVDHSLVTATLGAHAGAAYKFKSKSDRQNEQLDNILRLNHKFQAGPPEAWQNELDQIKKLLWRLESENAQMKEKAVADAEQIKTVLWRVEGRNNRIQKDLTARLEKERAAARDLSKQKDTLGRRVIELENVLAPRMRSIVTLRPLRYVIAERNRLKAGGPDRRIDPHTLKPKTASGMKGAAGSLNTPTPASIVESVRAVAGSRGAPNADANGANPAPNLGIAVYAHDRADCVTNVLEALARQNGLSNVHVWIDGDQGRHAKRTEVDFVHECVKAFPVKAIHRNRGNFGFRKMMLLSMKHMMAGYERILFLEDDCFPTRSALSDFDAALDAIEDQDGTFSVYGHPFLTSGEEEGLFRFQGWGWATTRRKLEPMWRKLMDCYWMTEEEYLVFVDENLTPSLEKLMNVTPPRQPTDTLRKFFAWDETLGLLTAVAGQRHLRTKERLIYNFGAGAKSSHFSSVEHFKDPPYNMVSIDAVWDHF